MNVYEGLLYNKFYYTKYTLIHIIDDDMFQPAALSLIGWTGPKRREFASELAYH